MYENAHFQMFICFVKSCELRADCSPQTLPYPRHSPLPLPLTRESENSLGTFSPPPACRPHRPAPRCIGSPRNRSLPLAARSAPRTQAGGAAEARRRASLLKFRFRSLVVISRPRALRQACVSCDALLYFCAAHSISLASRSWHGSTTARCDRRARGGRSSRVLRSRRMPSSPRAGTH